MDKNFQGLVSLYLSRKKLLIRSILVVMEARRASRITRAAIDSTTTTARGTMMGSWRPFMRTSIGSPRRFTVSWTEAIDGVGLKAARKMMGAPSLSPPVMPPE